MLSVQRIHQLFPDKIDCVKLITINKATKGKDKFWSQNIFLLVVDYFDIGVMYSCEKGAKLLADITC